MGQIGEPEKIVHIPDPVGVPGHEVVEPETSPVPEYVPEEWQNPVPVSVPDDGGLSDSNAESVRSVYKQPANYGA